MPSDADADLLGALERRLCGADPPQLARLLGDLERLKATLWQRLLHATAAPLAAAPADPVDELRHLTPQQVAGLLNLKAAYVHELCRTGRLPAAKSGKYWMIPVAGLRRWLASTNRDVDEGVPVRLQSLDRLGDTRSPSRTGPAGRPRRSPMV